MSGQITLVKPLYPVPLFTVLVYFFLHIYLVFPQSRRREDNDIGRVMICIGREPENKLGLIPSIYLPGHRKIGSLKGK